MLVFLPREDETSTNWEPHTLPGPQGVLLARRRAALCKPDDPRWQALLLPLENLGRPRCAYVLKRDVQVTLNGLPALSFGLLTDRDEFSLATWPGARLYYSSESAREIEPFHETGEPVHCARSKILITEGMPCVRCACGLYYIQSEDVPAFTYDETCVGCGGPTVLGYAWQPERLVKSVGFDLARYRQMVLEASARVSPAEETPHAEQLALAEIGDFQHG